VLYRLHESLKVNFRDNQACDPRDLQSVRGNSLLYTPHFIFFDRNAIHSGCVQGIGISQLRDRLSSKIVAQAYVGGVYRDQGLEAVSRWLNPLFQARVVAAHGDLEILHLLVSDSGTAAFLPTVEPSTHYLSPDITPKSSDLTSHMLDSASLDFSSLIPETPPLPPAEGPASTVSSHLVENPVASRHMGLARPKRNLMGLRRPRPSGEGNLDTGKQRVVRVYPGGHTEMIFSVSRVATPVLDSVSREYIVATSPVVGGSGQGTGLAEARVAARKRARSNGPMPGAVSELISAPVPPI
jgi:hypothetical protein